MAQEVRKTIGVGNTSNSRLQSTMFEAGIFIVLAVLAYIYLAGPKMHEYSDRKGRLDTLTIQQQDLENQQKTFDQLLATLREKQDSIVLLDDALPLENKGSRLYILVDNLIQGSGMSASSISVDINPAVAVAGKSSSELFQGEHRLMPVNISISTTGTLEQLSGFLKLIESSNRLIDVSSLEVSQGKADQLIFKLTLKAYTFALDATKTAGAK